jgi:hypothetical protein
MTMGDLEAFKTHAKSIRPLITSAGGLEALRRLGVAKSLISHWEVTWSYNPQTRISICPQVPARSGYLESFPSAPLPPEIKALVVKLPIGMQRLTQQGSLSVRTIEILARVVDVTTGKTEVLEP